MVGAASAVVFPALCACWSSAPGQDLSVEITSQSVLRATLVSFPGETGDVAFDAGDDDRLYVIQDDLVDSGGGIYPVDLAGENHVKGERIVAADRPSAIAFTADGDLWFVRDYDAADGAYLSVVRQPRSGAPYVVEEVIRQFGTTADDDAIALQIAPPGFEGDDVAPGDLVIGDRGADGNAPNAFYVYPPSSPRGDPDAYSEFLATPAALAAFDDKDLNDFAFSADGGSLYAVFDTGQIVEIGPDGVVVREARPLGIELSNIAAIAVNPADGRLWVADDDRDQIWSVDPTTGHAMLELSFFKVGEARPDYQINFSEPCLAFSSSGDKLVVSDNDSGGWLWIFDLFVEGDLSPCPGGLYGANLLANPSFEDHYVDDPAEYVDGDIVQYPLQTDPTTSRGRQGWSSCGFDLCALRKDGAGSGARGDFFAMGGRWSGGTGEISCMSQEIDLLAVGHDAEELDSGLLLVGAGGYLSRWTGDDDSAGFTVSFLDAGRSVIGTALSTGQRSHDEWTPYSVEDLPLPSGTRFILFEIEFEKRAGTNNDGRADDVWLVISRSAPPRPMIDRNLLADPGFESGAAGWFVRAGNPRARIDGLDGVPAATGSWYMFGGQRGSDLHPNRSIACQEVVLGDHGFAGDLVDDAAAGLYVRAGGMLYSWQSVGQARISVVVLDDGNGVLFEYSSGRVRDNKTPFPVDVETPLPPGARKIRFEYDAHDPEGTNLDGYLDDAYLIITRSTHCRTPGGPLVAAHRGNSSVAPENTLSAILAARDAGADLVEFDVYASASGDLVVIHDSTVDRTSDGSGRVDELNFEDLRALDMGSWFSPDFAGETIPTFEEAILATMPWATPLIEHKSGSAESYIGVLQNLGVVEDVIIISFNWSFLKSVHDLEPHIRLGALGSGSISQSTLDDIEASGASIVSWEKSGLDAAAIGSIHGRGLEVVVWTANSISDIEKFIALGVDAITTDYPAAVDWRIEDGSFRDCNGNGADDALDISSGSSNDCDGNTVPDECDLGCGRLHDDDGDGVPDECVQSAPFVRGDPNEDGVVDISDPVFILFFLFAGHVQPGCVRGADANGDDLVDLSDSVHLLTYLFLDGPGPEAPFPGCGVDETSALDCESHEPCR
jgi:glycerophosphoryl diester phosphodiesterase